MNDIQDGKKFLGYEDKLAIVVVGYNRIDAITRLLNSLNAAEYPVSNIPLVISLDYGGGEKIRDEVLNYEWKHGPKFCIFHEKNLKLRKHIFSCLSLSEYFKGVIVLEDDLYVSPYFYYYALKSLDFYGNDNNVAAISLYSTRTNFFTSLPLNLMRGESDVYAAQVVETWGECVNYRMWSDFKKWMDKNSDINWSEIDMYERISNWKNAWSKYFFAYIITCNKFYVYPYTSLTTCFADEGVHNSGVSKISYSSQAVLQSRKLNYTFLGFEELYKYDVYYNPVGLWDELGVPKNELVIDLYNNRKYKSKRYLLTTKKLSFKIEKSFALRLKPMEANIYCNLYGEGLYLYDTNKKVSKCESTYPQISIYDYSFDSYFSHKYFISMFKAAITFYKKVFLLRLKRLSK